MKKDPLKIRIFKISANNFSSAIYLDEGRPLSPRSRIFARHDFEDFSFSSNSFILFCIMMLFLVMIIDIAYFSFHRDDTL